MNPKKDRRSPWPVPTVVLATPRQRPVASSVRGGGPGGIRPQLRPLRHRHPAGERQRPGSRGLVHGDGPACVSSPRASSAAVSPPKSSRHCSRWRSRWHNAASSRPRRWNHRRLAASFAAMDPPASRILVHDGGPFGNPRTLPRRRPYRRLAASSTAAPPPAYPRPRPLRRPRQRPVPWPCPRRRPAASSTAAAPSVSLGLVHAREALTPRRSVVARGRPGRRAESAGAVRRHARSADIVSIVN